MPAKSAKQEKFMQAVAHSPSFAKKVGVSQSVGREFTKKGTDMKKMNKGGSYRKVADGIAKKGKTKGSMVKMAAGGIPGRPAMTGLNRAAAMSGRSMPTTGGSALTSTPTKSLSPTGSQTGVLTNAPTQSDAALAQSAYNDMMAQSGGRIMPMPLKKGGSFRASANGVAKKGKTKGSMVKMAAGGRPSMSTGLTRASEASGRTFRKGGKMKGCK